MYIEEPYEPRPGDYGVVATGGVVSWLIRIFTFSPVNHAFVYIGDGKVVEAQPGGARITDVSRYRDIIWNRHDNLTDDQRQAIVKNAKALLNTPYGFLDIGALLLAFFGVHWAWITERVAREDRLICSQLVDVAYKRAGKHLFADELPQNVRPVDLMVRLLYI